MLQLEGVAGLIRVRNAVEAEIARVIGRPAHSGHIAEFVASVIFDVALHSGAATKASDGIFRSGPLEGKSVNIKYGTRRDGMLNLVHSADPKDHPDTYLVLTGPDVGAISSKGMAAPWVIDQVYVFAAPDLVEHFAKFGKVPGTATSLPKQLWAQAQVFPIQTSHLIELNPAHREALALFGTPPSV